MKELDELTLFLQANFYYCFDDFRVVLMLQQHSSFIFVIYVIFVFFMIVTGTYHMLTLIKIVDCPPQSRSMGNSRIWQFCFLYFLNLRKRTFEFIWELRYQIFRIWISFCTRSRRGSNFSRIFFKENSTIGLQFLQNLKKNIKNRNLQKKNF